TRLTQSIEPTLPSSQGSALERAGRYSPHDLALERHVDQQDGKRDEDDSCEQHPVFGAVLGRDRKVREPEGQRPRRAGRVAAHEHEREEVLPPYADEL